MHQNVNLEEFLLSYPVYWANKTPISRLHFPVKIFHLDFQWPGIFMRELFILNVKV